MKAWLELFEFYIEGVILLSVAVGGVVGNVFFLSSFLAFITKRLTLFIGKHA